MKLSEQVEQHDDAIKDLRNVRLPHASPDGRRSLTPAAFRTGECVPLLDKEQDTNIKSIMVRRNAASKQCSAPHEIRCGRGRRPIKIS